MSVKPVDMIGSTDGAAAGAWVRPLRDALRGLRYGSVELVVHDGRVVQIERREKVRFDEAARRLPDHRGRRPQTILGPTGPPEDPFRRKPRRSTNENRTLGCRGHGGVVSLADRAAIGAGEPPRPTARESC